MRDQDPRIVEGKAAVHPSARLMAGRAAGPDSRPDHGREEIRDRRRSRRHRSRGDGSRRRWRNARRSPPRAAADLKQSGDGGRQEYPAAMSHHQIFVPAHTLT